MPKSQNFRFNGFAPKDKEFEHPVGADIIRNLEKKLKNIGWEIKPFENWRDCGWSINCEQNEVKIAVTLSAMPEPEWILQICALYNPGFLGRLFKKKSTASEDHILQLAKDVHEIFLNQNGYGKFRWCWNNLPEEHNSTTKPEKFK